MGKLIRNGQEFGGSAEQASRISYDNSDSIIHATNLQSAIDELAGGSQSIFVPTVRTINGLDLSTDRVLKSAQFAESVTGEKMLANLLYSQVSTWDSGAKKSIKMADDTYLDASGVTVDSAGTTLERATGTVTVLQGTATGETAVQRIGKIVWLRISARDVPSNITDAQVFATIPAGFRPDFNVRGVGGCGNQLYSQEEFCYFIVQSNGEVSIQKRNGGTAVNISVCYFT